MRRETSSGGPDGPRTPEGEPQGHRGRALRGLRLLRPSDHGRHPPRPAGGLGRGPHRIRSDRGLEPLRQDRDRGIDGVPAGRGPLPPGTEALRVHPETAVRAPGRGVPQAGDRVREDGHVHQQRPSGRSGRLRRRCDLDRRHPAGDRGGARGNRGRDRRHPEDVRDPGLPSVELRKTDPARGLVPQGRNR